MQLAEKETGIPAVFVLGFPLVGAAVLHRSARARLGRQIVSICCSRESRSQPVVKDCTVAKTLRRLCADVALILRISRVICDVRSRNAASWRLRDRAGAADGSGPEPSERTTGDALSAR